MILLPNAGVESELVIDWFLKASDGIIFEENASSDSAFGVMQMILIVQDEENQDTSLALFLYSQIVEGPFSFMEDDCFEVHRLALGI